MNLGEVLALGPTCEVCKNPARQLYPLTRYDPTVRRWKPVRACLSCLGPTGNEPSFRAVTLNEMLALKRTVAR